MNEKTAVVVVVVVVIALFAIVAIVIVIVVIVTCAAVAAVVARIVPDWGFVVPFVVELLTIIVFVVKDLLVRVAKSNRRREMGFPGPAVTVVAAAGVAAAGVCRVPVIEKVVVFGNIVVNVSVINAINGAGRAEFVDKVDFAVRLGAIGGRVLRVLFKHRIRFRKLVRLNPGQ